MKQRKVTNRQNNTFCSRAARTQRGVGMVELLVALLIMSIGVLGYAGLQLRALNSTSEAYVRGQAIAIARDAVERIMVNPAAIDTYKTAANWPAKHPTTLNTNCYKQDCLASDIADFDIAQIAWHAGTLLPQGKVQVSDCVGSNAVCVRVAWNEDTPADCEDANGVVGNVDCVVLEVVP